MIWKLSNRADKVALEVADRHYNRQKPGTPQFVPPGRCVVLTAPQSVWVTSWPFSEYVKHAWAGAWVNSCFRKECKGKASDYIRDAIAATRAVWPNVPDLGMISFIDPRKTPGTVVRGERIHGYCYGCAGFKHVGFTKGGLWAWQILESDMPEAQSAGGTQFELGLTDRTISALTCV